MKQLYGVHSLSNISAAEKLFQISIQMVLYGILLSPLLHTGPPVAY